MMDTFDDNNLPEEEQSAQNSQEKETEFFTDYIHESEKEAKAQEPPRAEQPAQPVWHSEPPRQDANVRREYSYGYYGQPQQPVREADPYRSTYHGTGTGRKESPYANGPYQVNRTYSAQEGYRYQPYYEPPKKTKAPKAPKQKTGFWRKAIAVVLTLALMAASCTVTASFVNQRWEKRTDTMEAFFAEQIDNLQNQIDQNQIKQNSVPEASAPVPSSPVSADGSLTPGQVYAQNLDAVVAISCVVSNGYAKGTSKGSGFIISEDGYVITNHHVINGAISIQVVMDNGTEYEAKLVGSDSMNDLAVLKTEQTGLPYVKLGNSSELVVGDQVVAIGSPLGELTSTMTVGYISGKDRTIATDGASLNMLQTDAAINPGNSGGPLFNMKGEVIGITTAKYSGMTSSGASIEGIGFAVPIDDVMDEITDLIEVGHIRGGYLGVIVSDMNTETAAVYNLPVGAYVRSVEEDGCAAEAGVEAGDIIIAVGEYEIDKISDLTKALRNFNPGDKTTLVVFRKGAEVTLDVILDEKQEDIEEEPAATEPEATQPQQGKTEQELLEEFLEKFFGGR